MAHAGSAWRGWFPVRGELTSGMPDRKEGHLRRARAPGRPPAGARRHAAARRQPVPARRARAGDPRLARRTAPGGRRADAAIAVGLGLPAGWFEQHLTGDPTVLFRIFHYPALPDNAIADEWGVGEHTDYGLLTLLAQDAARRAPGAHAVGRLDRGAGRAGRAGVQHRRHARQAHRGPLPVDAAPGAQRQRARPAVVPVLLRPVVGRRGRRRSPSTAHRPPTTPTAAGTARASTPGPAATATTSSAKVAKVFPDLFERVESPSVTGRPDGIGRPDPSGRRRG